MLQKEHQEDFMKTRVVHSLPGRLRLTAEGLQYLKDESAAIAAELAAIPGVRLVRVTPCTGGVLLQYDRGALDSGELCEQVDLVLARHSMAALRQRHTENGEDVAEAPMTTAQLAKRLAVNAGALVLGNPLLTAPLVGGAPANFTSLEAIASLGLSAPMAISAWEGLRRDMRPNADFLTVTSIVASLLAWIITFGRHLIPHAPREQPYLIKRAKGKLTLTPVAGGKSEWAFAGSMFRQGVEMMAHKA